MIKNLIPRQYKNKLKLILSGNPLNQKKKEPKVLLPDHGNGYSLTHIAAFTGRKGNAGDILLPAVLRDLFVKEAQDGIDWTSINVRRPVDKKAIKAINQSKGLVIGGGGLFLKDTNANNISGWQWACSVEQINSINVPFCLFAVGYNRFRDQPDFEDFFVDNLRVLTEQSVYIGLRNHGSIRAICKYLPTKLHHKIIFQPCMTTLIALIYQDLFDFGQQRENFIALNCAFDRSELRFGNTKKKFLSEIADGVCELCKKTGMNLKYYSHYVSDEEMLEVFEDKNIKFELCDLSQLDSRGIIEAYTKPSLVLGMRGHAQMIPFGCRTPILSLVSHDKLQWFLNDISQPDWSVDIVNSSDISGEILSKGKSILDSYTSVSKNLEEEQKKLWYYTEKNVELFIQSL